MKLSFLEKLKSDRNLVSIERSELNSYKLQGFILHYSNDLLLLNYVYDFRLDGLLLICINDITNIESSKTDIFQTQVLKDIGSYHKVPFNEEYSFSDYSSAIKEITKDSKIIIIEDEDIELPSFFIGKLNRINSQSVTLREFTGVARWLESTTNIKFENITSIQVGNHYSTQYSNYFQRIKNQS